MAKQVKQGKREVKYSELESRIYDDSNPITVEQAMEWMGWYTEEQYVHDKMKEFPNSKESKWQWKEGEYDFVDMAGMKVRCLNNAGNRDLQMPWAKERAYDILNLNWRMNGEAIIIGETGLTLSAQHRLLGLIFAWQMWMDKTKHHPWKQNWKEAPYITSFVSFGVKETPDVLRTIDNVRPRTLADVLFSNNKAFSNKSRKERVQLTRIVDHAVKFLWSRTGKDRKAYNALAPRRTNSEAVAFIDDHPKLLEYAELLHRLYQQDWKKFVRDVIHPGYAVGLLYMMAASNTDGEAYRSADPPREGTPKRPVIDWGNEKAALEFWNQLINKEDSYALTGLRLTLKDPVHYGDRDEQMTVINEAWRMWLQGEEIPEDGIDIDDRYLPDEDTGEEFLAKPCLANGEEGLGIDLGPPEDPRIKKKEDKEQKEEEPEGGDEGFDESSGGDEPNEDELAEMRAEQERIDAEKLAVKQNGKTPKKSVKPAKKPSKKKGKGYDEEEGEIPLVAAGASDE